jgi:hypothetical protein
VGGPLNGLARVVEPGLVDKLVAIHRGLDGASIPHGFGGAIALAYAVEEPRATDDIDVNISVPVGEARRVLDAMPEPVEARADVLATIKRDGQDRLRWGRTPVDLFFPQHPFHDVVAARTAQQPFAGITIPVISPTDLVVFKTMFNRSRDWPDIEAVLRAGTVDETEALRWTRDILGADSPAVGHLVDLIDEVRRHPAAPPASDPNPWRPLRRDD